MTAWRNVLTELARERQRFGYRRLTALLRREGRPINHKRVYRLYRELGLAMRRRKRRQSGQRLAATTKTLLQRATRRWAMDFVADTLAHGRAFRVLTIIDEHARECLAVETDISLPGLRASSVYSSGFLKPEVYRTRFMSITVLSLTRYQNSYQMLEDRAG